MVDNRSAGFFGIGGAFNFKGGDISGTAAKSQDDKMGSDAMYANLRGGEQEEEIQSPYMDRSAVLRATLNSLAMMNVANVINARKKELTIDEKEEQEKKEQKRKKDEDEGVVLQAIEEHLIGDDFDEDFDFASELD